MLEFSSLTTGAKPQSNQVWGLCGGFRSRFQNQCWILPLRMQLCEGPLALTGDAVWTRACDGLEMPDIL
jgi:hypothetical protein